jgi:hypothetical protein
MKTVVEMVSQEALPLIRSLVTKNLLENGLSQKQVADRLGLTQPAISQYKRNLRGKKGEIFSENPGLFESLCALSKKIAAGEMSMNQATSEVFRLCTSLKEQQS